VQSPPGVGENYGLEDLRELAAIYKEKEPLNKPYGNAVSVESVDGLRPTTLPTATWKTQTTGFPHSHRAGGDIRFAIKNTARRENS